MNGKLKIFLLLLLLLVSVSAVSANEVGDSNVSSNEVISDTLEVSDISKVSAPTEDNVLSVNSHKINSSNYYDYFNSKGNLISSDVGDGDTIELDGSFSDCNFNFEKSVNVVGTSSNNMKNCMLTFYEKASGSSIFNLNIFNTNNQNYGIFLNGASSCVIHDCFINNTGASSYAICVANSANYNNVTNNNLHAYGITYGHGTRSTPPLLICGAHYNYFANNYITCWDANAIYLSSYDGGPLKGGVSNYNTIYNNTVKYEVLPTSWAYGVQIMGSYNNISFNRIIGAYRGISATGIGNMIISNKIINITGADFNNPGVVVGGEYGIASSYYSIIINNTVENAIIVGTASAISTLDNSTVENNTVNVILSRGIGITPYGNNVTVKNNNIITYSGSGIYYKSAGSDLKVIGNNITSQSGVGILIQKVNSKKLPNNVTITNNYISTNNNYAIDAKDVDASSYWVIDSSNAISKGTSSVIATPEGEINPSSHSYDFKGNVYNINPENYDEYINENGNLNTSIKDGDILNFSGEFSNKIIFINSAIKITANNAIFYNSTFRATNVDGVWFENLKIRNNKAERLNAWGILIYKVSGATVLNCDIEVYDPNAAYAIYVVESDGVDVLNNNLSSTGNYLTYTLLAHTVEECRFINNTIFTNGTGVIHKFEGSHCFDGDDNCLDSNCLDGSCLDGSCLDGDCLDGSCLDGSCLDGDCLDGSCLDGSCLDGDCLDGSCLDGSCLDGDCLDGDCLDGSCLDGNTISGNHVVAEVYRTYGILMVYASDNIISNNKVNVTSQLNQTHAVIGENGSTNSIVGIDLYYNSHNNVFSNNDIYVKANDNYIYGMGVLGFYTGHDAPEGEGATNNQFIDNNISLIGSYFVEGIVIGDESDNTTIKGNIINLQSDNVAYGINLEMSQKSIILNNTLTLNSDIIYGLEAIASDDNIMDNNEISASAKQAYGMLLSNSKNNNITNNKVMANGSGENITFMNFDSISGGNAGIYLKSNSSSNIIKDNNITSKKGFAIVIDDIAVDNSICNNYLVGEDCIANDAINSSNSDNVLEYNYKYSVEGLLSEVNVNYLETSEIKLAVENNLDGAVVNFYIMGEYIGNATVSDGVAKLIYKFDEYTPAFYLLSADISKENFKTTTFNSYVNVEKGILDVVLSNVSGKKKSNVNVIATIKNELGNPLENVLVKFYRANSKGEYSLYMGEARTSKDGIVNYDYKLPSISSGNYKLCAIIDGLDYYESLNKTADLIVFDLIPSSIIMNSEVYSGGVLASLKDNYNNPLSDKTVIFEINGILYSAKTDSNGLVNLPILSKGIYNVKISFDGDADYDNCSKTGIINVLPIITENKDISVYWGNTIKYQVRIMGSDGKSVGAGQQVIFKLNGASYPVYTDANGYATLSVKLKTGTYVCTVDYKGFTVSNKITIKPTLIAKNIVKKKAKTIKFSVKVVDKNGKKLKNKKVTFKVKGKKYTAKTNKKGVATVSIKNLKAGKFAITSSYGGCTIKNTILVKK